MRCCQVIGPSLLWTTLCARHFFFYPFTASNGSEGTTAGRVVSHRSTTEHHGFRSKEARCARKQNIDYAKQLNTPHCWLPNKVMYPANLTRSFSWLTRSTPIYIVEERSNVYSDKKTAAESVEARLRIKKRFYWLLQPSIEKSI